MHDLLFWYAKLHGGAAFEDAREDVPEREGAA